MTDQLTSNVLINLADKLKDTKRLSGKIQVNGPEQAKELQKQDKIAELKYLIRNPPDQTISQVSKSS